MPVAVCAAVVGGVCRQDVPSASTCLHTEHGCAAQYHGTDLGHGQLFVTERDIIWRRQDEMGFKLQYKQLIAHAVSKDTSVYPVPCVYMLYENPPNPVAARDSEEEEEEGGNNVEIRIAPATEGSIPRIFEAISDGQLLHPEEESEGEEDQEEGGWDDMISGGGGLAMSNQIRFDSDGQVLLDNQEDQDDRRFQDMEED